MAKPRQRTYLAFDFPEGAFTDIDEVQEFEECLLLTVGKLAELDGHDFGVGGTTYFFYTYEPEESFERCRTLLTGKHPGVRATSRESPDEDPEAIFPMGRA